MSGRTPSPMLWRVCHSNAPILNGRSPLVKGIVEIERSGSPILFRTTMTPFADRRERDGIAPSEGGPSKFNDLTGS